MKRNILVLLFWFSLLCLIAFVDFIASLKIHTGKSFGFFLSVITVNAIVVIGFLWLKLIDFLTLRQCFSNTVIIILLTLFQILFFRFIDERLSSPLFFAVALSIVIPLLLFLIIIKFFELQVYKSNQLLWPGDILIDLKWVIVLKIGKVFQKYQMIAPAFLLKKTHISTSHFFRDFQTLDKRLLSHYAENKIPLKILSVGAARGQEPYSVSAFCTKNNIPVKIYAIDISEEAIQDAKNATYSLKYELNRQKTDKFAEKTFNEFRDYFLFTGDTFAPKEEIRNNVEFMVGDASSISFTGELDFILARKMLYYLPKEIQKKAINAFVNALKPGLSPWDHLLFCDATYHYIPRLKSMISAAISAKDRSGISIIETTGTNQK